MSRRWAVALLALLVAGCSFVSGATGPSDEEELGDLAAGAGFDGPPIELYLRVEPEHLDELYDRDVRSDDRLPAAFRVGPDGDYSPVRAESLRFRGNSSRQVAKKSFSLRTDTPVPGIGSDRLNLNAMWTDPSQLREHLVWWMFDELDRPASRSTYVDLYINDVYEGLYVYVQRVDHDLLEQQGVTSRDLTLVRDRTRFEADERRSVFGIDLDEVGERPETWLAERFDQRDDADWAALAELVRWVEETPPGPRFARGLEERFLVDHLIDWIAVNTLIVDLDSYGDDYWLYRDNTDPEARWGVLPWDHDLAFGSHYLQGFFTTNELFRYEFAPETNASRNALIRGILDTPELRQRIDERLVDLMDTTFSPQRMTDHIDAIADRIRASAEVEPGPDAFVLHPKQHFSDVVDTGLHVEAVKEFIGLRWAYLRSRIEQTDSGSIDLATVDLTDVAPGDRVLLTDVQGWTIAAFTLEGADRAGHLTVSVVPGGPSPDIDHTWVVEHAGGRLEGELTLYYRNTPTEGCGIPRCENWFRPNSEPIELTGDQRHLQVAIIEPDGLRHLPSSANRYANMVTARMTLDAEAELTLVVP